MVTYDILIISIILSLIFGGGVGLFGASLCVVAKDNKDEVNEDDDRKKFS